MERRGGADLALKCKMFDLKILLSFDYINLVYNKDDCMIKLWIRNRIWND